MQTCRRHYPGGTADGIGLLPWPQRRRPSPHVSWVGSRISGFEACSAFTRVTACLLAGPLSRSFPSKASAISLPPPPLRLLLAGATVARWELHPLKNDALARRIHMATCSPAPGLPLRPKCQEVPGSAKGGCLANRSGPPPRPPCQEVPGSATTPPQSRVICSPQATVQPRNLPRDSPGQGILPWLHLFVERLVRLPRNARKMAAAPLFLLTEPHPYSTHPPLWLPQASSAARKIMGHTTAILHRIVYKSRRTTGS
jgi:hypothetical protein